MLKDRIWSYLHWFRFLETLPDCLQRPDKKALFSLSCPIVPQGSDLSVIRGIISHLVSNCFDHAIEDPKVRLERGKSDIAKIHLSVKYLDGNFEAVLSDDGQGIERDQVAAQAEKLGVRTSSLNKNSANPTLLETISIKGLSTKGPPTERGVGMGATINEIQENGGSLELLETGSNGSTFKASWPAQEPPVQTAIEVRGREDILILSRSPKFTYRLVSMFDHVKSDATIYTADSSDEMKNICRKKDIKAIISDEEFPSDILTQLATIEPIVPWLFLTSENWDTALVTLDTDGETFNYRFPYN